MHSSESSLWDLSRRVSMRWMNPENPQGKPGAGGMSNFGRKGEPCRYDFEAGGTLVLGEAEGPGVIRRMWITESTRSAQSLRGLVLRIYWDGADKPAVEAPLGDFFNSPLGRMTPFFTSWFENPEGRNFNCLLPMPFRKSFKITVSNETPHAIRLFWYHIEFTVGDELGDVPSYLHAHYRRENPTEIRRDFTILPKVAGRGRYLGCNLGVRINTSEFDKTWWGEGEAKIYLDGDDASGYPTLCGTGAEDYIATAWGQGQHVGPWTGSPIYDRDRHELSMYRFHGPDPVYFEREIRVALQQIGGGTRESLLLLLERREREGLGPLMKLGDGTQFHTFDSMRREAPGFFLFERRDDVCATAYFYLDQPGGVLPAIADYNHRTAGLVPALATGKRADV